MCSDSLQMSKTHCWWNALCSYLRCWGSPSGRFSVEEGSRWRGADPWWRPGRRNRTSCYCRDPSHGPYESEEPRARVRHRSLFILLTSAFRKRSSNQLCFIYFSKKTTKTNFAILIRKLKKQSALSGVSDLWTRAQCVEHVEKDKAGEGHGGVSRSDHVVLQLKNKHKYSQICWMTSQRRTTINIHCWICWFCVFVSYHKVCEYLQLLY